MPYENEHSARLKDPGDFNPKTFRRTAGGTIYGSVKVPSSVGIIWGKLKGKDGPKDYPVPQALRFATSSWTADKAKKWLKDNKVKYISFEAAKKSGAAMSESVPSAACLFSEPAEISFARGADDSADGENTFKIVAYSGGIIPEHWYWGNVAFDLTNTKFDKARTPVFEQVHGNGNRVGFTTKQEVDKRIYVEGRFLGNPAAQQLRTDMQEGFPMQASVYIPPTEVEFVKEGESAEVNGHKLKGPGAIFRQARVKDVVICTFGHDANTKALAFAEGGKQEINFSVIKDKEQIMDDKEKMELTVATFAAEYPDLHGQVTADAKTEGEKSAMERFTKLQALAPDDPAFVVEQFKAGATIEQAMAALITKLRESPKPPEKKQTPAEQEFVDSAPKKGEGAAPQGGGDDGKPESYTNKVAEFSKAGKTKAEAYIAAAREMPKSHAAWKTAHPSTSEE